MSTRVVFFASIREALGTSGIELELPPDCSVSDLLGMLRQEFGEDADVLAAENTRVAVDQELVSGNPVIGSATEVAFFPPVTGG